MTMQKKGRIFLAVDICLRYRETGAVSFVNGSDVVGPGCSGLRIWGWKKCAMGSARHPQI